MGKINEPGLLGLETDYDFDLYTVEVYAVIDKKLRPNYNKMIGLINRIRQSSIRSADSRDNVEIVERDDIFGIYFYDQIVDDKKELGEAVENLAKKFVLKFGLWKIPFVPYKEGNTELEVLVDSFRAYKGGQVYTPDKISFYGTSEDLKKTLEFYKGFNPL